MDTTKFALLMANLAVKAALTVAAYHFYTIGDMFLAGICLGWVLLEVLDVILALGAALMFTIHFILSR